MCSLAVQPPCLLQALVDKHLVKGGSNAIKLLEMLLGSPVSTGGDFWTEDTSSQSLGDFKPLSLKAKACSPNIFRYIFLINIVY